MNVFIGGAWPYANGSLHIGHIAALLPGDILARYHRLKGHKVCYVSGSDCHGTPIQIRARRDGVSPEIIAERYHEEFRRCFEQLAFSYDLYNRTNDPYHAVFVQDFFTRLAEKGRVYPQAVKQLFCENCNQFLPDRFVEGECPACAKPARGDQCESCGLLLEPHLLLKQRCGICGREPVFRESEHFYLSLSNMQQFLEDYVNNASGWRANAVSLAKRYLSEGLRDRAVTRDLEWGVPVPVEGFEDKKIYVWVEAVLGYLSASKKWAEISGASWEEFWSSEALHYYVHGKDNIPFHTIILPALLEAYGDLHLPDRIISSEYVTLEGRKISTSQNWAVWIPDLLESYDPDSIRYFFIANGPEKRDADFSWKEYVNRHNGELLGAYGNLVNRNLVFIQKSFDGAVPDSNCDGEIKQTLHRLYPAVGDLIEGGSFKAALDELFSFVRSANQYFDREQPWTSVKSEPLKCRRTLFTCVQIIANLAILLEPFLPISSGKVHKMLAIDEHEWAYREVPGGSRIGPVSILFARIDRRQAEKEMEKLLG